MEIINKEIHINRGDRGTIRLKAQNGKFQTGDKIKLSIVEKNKYSNVILQKTYVITQESEYAYITLSKEDTTIGDIISKKVEYYYEIEYNDDITLVGSDSQGNKRFVLYPEAGTKEGV